MNESLEAKTRQKTHELILTVGEQIKNHGRCCLVTRSFTHPGPNGEDLEVEIRVRSRET